jgi:hypothetical protein
MSHLPLRKRKLSFKSTSTSFSLASALALALALAFFLTSNLFSQSVGINTTTPLAGLHVVSNDGLLIESEYGMGNLPLAGFGTRHLFNPKTGAFRTGRLTDEDGGIYEDWWDFLNVGDYSIVAGVNSKASGYASAAFGHKNQALGLTAFAAGGRNNIANGYMSFVTGFENTAQSYVEVVIGQEATTYSPNSLTGFDLADRLFVVGNGINSSSRHNAFTIMKNGNIGVGTDAPQSLFDVDGTATMDKAFISDSLQSQYLSMTNGAVDGYVLKSDANGHASWTNPTSIFTNYWTANGNNIYNANSANIGIGTNNPLDKLHVSGSMRVEQGRINFTGTGYGTYVGHDAGLNDFWTLQNANTFIGELAGTNTNTGAENAVVGAFAFQSNVNGVQNTAMGHSAMQDNISGGYNTGIGYQALNENTTGNSNVALGYYALNHNNASGNVGIGESSGNDNINGTGNVFLGQSAGHSVLGSSNVMLGHEAGYNETGSNKLYIDNSNTSSPLIYGDFDNNKLVINDSLQSKFLHATLNAEVEGDLNMNNGKILFTNTGESIFIGEGAGDNDDLSNNSNVFIGQNAGQANINGADNIAMGSSALLSNTTGNANIGLGEFSLYNNSTGGINVAIGQHALENNQTGDNNIAIGFFSGNNSTGDDNTIIGQEAGFSTTGSGNVFLGRQAGYNETGSNKLYIDNSNTATPLIYGNFATNKVTINDSLATKNFVATQTAQVNGTLKINAGKIAFTSTGQSVFIGDQAGAADDLSNNNSVFIGHQAGKANTNGTNNIAIGAFALDAAANSNYNIAMGQDVLGNTGFSGGYNTGIGNFSLANVSSGSDNIAIGQNAGGTINLGVRNIAIGNYALDAATSGGSNTTIGYESLGSNVNGSANTTLGYYAGNSVTGSNNVMIGFNAGLLTTGSNNVMIGAGAGENETGSNKLYIDNSNTGSPLIQGDFATNEVTINDSLTVNKELSVGTSIANSTLEVNGSVAAKFKTPLVAGTTNPDASGMVWRYNSGTGTITLPSASTCANRMYVIINQTGTPRTISSYHDLTTTPVTSISSSVALWLMSDGSEWWQIK